MKRYMPLSDLFTQYFPFKVQKISIHAGFTCPNRDGKKGYGGCTYCNNQTFSPGYTHSHESITEQMQRGIAFFRHKYPTMKYLAYFQAYTNTYADLETLIAKYEEALQVPDVVGLIIGTRPDCMPDRLLDYLTELSKRTFVMVEYGVESTNDRTLDYINRGHNWQCSKETILRTAQRGIITGAHMILGLPGESREEIINHAKELSQLPIQTIKLHQLQIIRHTRMAKQMIEEPALFHLFEVDEYIDLAIDFIQHLRSDIVVERFISQSPKELLIAPDWGLKNYQFTDKVHKRLEERNAFQGEFYKMHEAK